MGLPEKRRSREITDVLVGEEVQAQRSREQENAEAKFPRAAEIIFLRPHQQPSHSSVKNHEISRQAKGKLTNKSGREKELGSKSITNDGIIPKSFKMQLMVVLHPRGSRIVNIQGFIQ